MSANHKLEFRASTLSCPAIGVFVVTLGLILLWSHYQLMWTDEFYPLQNDSAASLSRVAEIQMKTPTSLDPLTYNIFAHEAIGIFGSNKFSIRLPSFVGFLLMQVCLFVFTRRIAGERPAVFAMALPALTWVVNYAVQARPNGLLLGLAALVMLSWQTATRKKERRTGALVSLAVTLFAAINTHYYAVLLLVPICGAELLRSYKRRTLDWPVIVSIAIGMSGTLALLPFTPALAAFRVHYYNTNPIVVQFISHSYIQMFLGDAGLSLRMQHLLAVLGVLALAACVPGFLRYVRSGALDLPPAELLAVVLLAALPVFGFLLTYFVTKVIDVRYIIPAIAGVSILMALLLAPVLRRNAVYYSTLVVLFCGLFLVGLFHIRNVREDARITRATLVLAPQTRNSLAQYPGLPIYTTNPATYQIEGYYSPDADVRSRIGLMYSQQQDLKRLQSDYLSLTSLHMKANGSQRVTSFEALKAEPGVHLMLISREPWDWAVSALLESNARVMVLGPMYGYSLAAVVFPVTPSPTAPPAALR